MPKAQPPPPRSYITYGSFNIFEQRSVHRSGIVIFTTQGLFYISNLLCGAELGWCAQQWLMTRKKGFSMTFAGVFRNCRGRTVQKLRTEACPNRIRAVRDRRQLQAGIFLQLVLAKVKRTDAKQGHWASKLSWKGTSVLNNDLKKFPKIMIARNVCSIKGPSLPESSVRPVFSFETRNEQSQVIRGIPAVML